MRAMREGVPNLLDELASDATNVLLTLARISYTIRHGRVVTKDQAAAWALTQLPEDIRDPLACARLTYLGTSDHTSPASRSDAHKTGHYLAAELIGSP